MLKKAVKIIVKKNAYGMVSPGKRQYGLLVRLLVPQCLICSHESVIT